MKDLAALNAEIRTRIAHPSVPYVAPFAVFLVFLFVKNYLPFEYPIRVLAVAAVLVLFSRGIITVRVSQPLMTTLVGLLVFGLWIGPDLLWPGYRQHWLFHNMVTGTASSSLPEDLRANHIYLLFRVAGTALLVPVIEELFWRGWLMRFLIARRFEFVRLGAYSAFSFWITALLFASEHGPYWEVGLLAGIAYNAWMIRTRSLADCMLAHAVTNACLAAYVLGWAQWQYWL